MSSTILFKRLPIISRHTCVRTLASSSHTTTRPPRRDLPIKSLGIVPRAFARGYATVKSSKPPPPPPVVAKENLAVMIRGPKPETVDPEDDPLDLSQATLGITSRAAEQLRMIAMRENDSDVALRVFVESGGCHGYSTKIELTSMKEGDADYHFAASHMQPSNVLIDPMSLDLLKGSTLEFATELIGSAFKIVGNPQSGGGCGCGTSWEGKK